MTIDNNYIVKHTPTILLYSKVYSEFGFEIIVIWWRTRIILLSYGRPFTYSGGMVFDSARFRCTRRRVLIAVDWVRWCLSGARKLTWLLTKIIRSRWRHARSLMATIGRGHDATTGHESNRRWRKMKFRLQKEPNETPKNARTPHNTIKT